MKKIIKNNIKVIIAFIAGIIISGAGVYAVTVASSAVSYDNTSSGASATTVKAALDELYTKAIENINVNDVNFGMKSEDYVTGDCTTPPFNEGDYITITPTKTSFKIPKSLTGYTGVQTINPSELTLWRVIKKNSCNVEVVSEYTSSTRVYFKGTTGYRNLVGTLNIIASAYENPTYTVGSRMMGYDGQTLFLSDLSAFDGSTTTPPSTTSTPDLTSGTGQEYSGGVLGDTLYLKDYLLVKNVYGNVKANRVGTSTAVYYWLSSRSFNYNSATGFFFSGRYVYSSGSVGISNVRRFISSWSDDASSYSVRPILTLKSGVSIASGSGTSASPYILN